MAKLRNSYQIMIGLATALSLLKNQSGWDEETNTLQELIDQLRTKSTQVE